METSRARNTGCEPPLRVYRGKEGEEFDFQCAIPGAKWTDAAIDRGRGTCRVTVEPNHIIESVRDLQALLDLSDSGKNRELVFQSHGMREVVEHATRFASSSATVLLTGESGTGKELVARLIHEASPRCEKPYVCVNCAALPESLMESELFGHERGAFTGAVDSRIGRFEWANEGTLLLDEISEIPISIQAKLLRVLEEEEFHRIGENAVRRTDVRVLATTNRDLEAEVEKGNFRADLYHRLNVLDIKLPPLRERPEDIPVLVNRFIGYFRDEANVPVRGVSESAMRLLVDYSWPGNVRQLRNVIHRACVLTSSEIIQLQELPPLRSSSESMPDTLLNLTLAEVERLVILNSLDRFNGNKTAAAAHLGVTARTLSNKLKLYRQQECA